MDSRTWCIFESTALDSREAAGEDDAVKREQCSHHDTGSPAMVTTEPTHYAEPGWITRRIMNPAIGALTRAGVSVWGARELRVRGRRSGEWRSTVVNVLDHDGERYLVA